jgi:hypothetical protein
MRSAGVADAQQRVGQHQVVGNRHLQVDAGNGHDRHGMTGPLQQPGLVGEALAGRGGSPQRFQQQVASEALRRLGRPQAVAGNRANDPVALDLLDRVGDEAGGDGGAPLAGGDGDRVEQRRRRQRAGGVVDRRHLAGAGDGPDAGRD